MKKLSKYVLLVISSLYLSAAQADNYLLTMSKDDKTCQHMAKLFNSDLYDKGKLVLEEHKEFNWLNWDQQFFMIKHKVNKELNYDDKLIGNPSDYMEEYDSYTKYLKKGAFFDIDNNGEDELITFERRGGETFENRAYDRVSIYKGSALAKLSGAIISKQNKPEVGYLGALTNRHTLKEYPVKREDLYKTGAISHWWPSLTDSFIRPFLLNKIYYIALFSNVDTYISDPLRAYNQTIDDKNAIAVVKFTPSSNIDLAYIRKQADLFSMGKPSSETQDICYFVKTQVIQQGKR
ncbi:MAG: hypothetical protein GY928_30895 [Colwellia sp.]|nr:hypothetical protein [Colwellia sp.]